MPYQLIYILSKKRENYTINFSTLCNFFVEIWNYIPFTRLKLLTNLMNYYIYRQLHDECLYFFYDVIFITSYIWWSFMLSSIQTPTVLTKKKRNENHEKPNFTIWPKKFILFLYIVRWKTRTFLSIFRLNSKKQKNIRKKINRFFFKNSYTSFKCYMCTIIYWSRTLLVSLPTHHRSSFYFTWKCSRQRMIQ